MHELLALGRSLWYIRQNAIRRGVLRAWVLRSSVILLFLSFVATGQDTKPQTRAEQLEQERLQKQQHLTPEMPGRVEQIIDRVTEKDPVGRLLLGKPGIGMRFGGLITGAGFALGPRYSRPDLLSERMAFDISAVGSVEQFYSLDARLAFPRVGGGLFDATLLTRHSDFPSIQFFGIGPKTERWGKTNYRREDTVFGGQFALHPYRHWRLGYETAARLLNVGPGISDISPSTEEFYAPAEAPGVDRQAHYWVNSAFAALDFRDRPGDPHRGGEYVFRFQDYSDRTWDQYSFRLLEARATQYLPFFNQKRVIALRAKTLLTYTTSGNAVPFFLAPTLGGPDDLRGFTQFRFTDRDVIVFSGEYRWEVSTALDMALFTDSGNVFPRPGLIGFRNMETSGGLGFRVKTRNVVVLRLDLGVSREGFRIWFTTSNAFSR